MRGDTEEAMARARETLSNAISRRLRELRESAPLTRDLLLAGVSEALHVACERALHPRGVSAGELRAIGMQLPDSLPDTAEYRGGRLTFVKVVDNGDELVMKVRLEGGAWESNTTSFTASIAG